MRDGWIGDIADFAKYGLLRLLAADLRLGIVWYRTTHGDAPKKIVDSYLRESRPNDYTECDSTLLELISTMRAKGASLTVDDVAANGLLPTGTTFYGTPVSFPDLALKARLNARRAWLEAALAATEDCEMVFLDPDTGILPGNARPTRMSVEAAEYAYVDEVNRFLERGQSVVVVQFGRPQNLESEPVLARTRLVELSAELPQGLAQPWGLWWNVGHKVGLIIVPAAVHADTLSRRRDAILKHKGWSRLVSRL